MYSEKYRRNRHWNISGAFRPFVLRRVQIVIFSYKSYSQCQRQKNVQGTIQICETVPTQNQYDGG